MLTIQILGPGCANCHRLHQLAQSAVDELGVEAEITEVTDPLVFVDYDVLTTPGLVVNGKTVCSGRIPSLAEIRDFVTSSVSGG